MSKSGQKKIFINLPVKDLKKSIAFFTKLGYTFNPQFTDEKATCMIVSDTIFVMLLVEPFFKTFTHKEISDAKKAAEVIISISADSKEKVNELVNNAVAAGGSTPNKANDNGWMYQWGFQDLDGHLWETMYMDESAIPQQ
jgi:predicted lactoylglutathione lyase